MNATPVNLAEWRRKIAELYQSVRTETNENAESTCQIFRKDKNKLLKTHPQTPFTSEQQSSFERLLYYDYNPNFNVLGRINYDIPKENFIIELPDDENFNFTYIAKVEFTILEQDLELQLYWIEGYGGGLFLPFRDLTSKEDTYSGERYLIDTIKGADLGTEGDLLRLDFNYAYNPSCAYNKQWTCPLSPFENQLPIAIEAGEKSYVSTH